MSQSQWQFAQGPVSDNIMSAHNSLWTQLQRPTNSVGWTGPFYEPPTDKSMLMNGDLLLSREANQYACSKGTADLDRSLFWYPSSATTMVTGSGADLLLSPVSPSSDAKGTYSPIANYNPTTPACSSVSYRTSTCASKVASSPGYLPRTPQSAVGQQSACFELPMAHSMPFHMSNTNNQSDSVSALGSEQSSAPSQGSSPGAASWASPVFVFEPAPTAQDPCYQQSSFGCRPNSYIASHNRSAGHQQGQWSNTNNVPPQSHFQTRFVAPANDQDRVQREREDKVLVQMKRAGHTYRSIRKAIGRDVAESTLRGRYRSLTKPKENRVRAPKWTEGDVGELRFNTSSHVD